MRGLPGRGPIRRPQGGSVSLSAVPHARPQRPLDVRARRYVVEHALWLVVVALCLGALALRLGTGWAALRLLAGFVGVR